MNEIQAAEQAIYEILTDVDNDIGLSVYPYLANQSATFPLIIFNMQSPGKDTIVLGGNRLFSSPLYTIKVVGNTCFEDIDTYVSAIDYYLHKATASNTAGYIYSIIRESPLSYLETSDGVTYYHRGGLYRVVVQSVEYTPPVDDEPEDELPS